MSKTNTDKKIFGTMLIIMHTIPTFGMQRVSAFKIIQ